LKKVSDELRKLIIEHLQLLSSFEAQIEYELTVTLVDVPAELVCIWFDDLYHPDSPLFQAAFTRSEREILAATFHDQFEKVSDSLPQPIPKITELHARKEWQEMNAAALATLRALGCSH
jgi:hypothetical protein